MLPCANLMPERLPRCASGVCCSTAPSACRAPTFRSGSTPILGLIPWIGDLTTPLFSAVLLLHAVRMRIPKIVQLRMLMNAAIDFAIGVIPVIGDLFDFGWKANVRNLALLERHANPGTAARASDWAFVLIVLGVLALLAITPFLILGWLLAHLHL